MAQTSVIEQRPGALASGAAEGAPTVPSRRRFPRPPSLAGLFALTLAVVVWTVQTRPLFDNSFMWHLRTGHWILDHGIPRHDIYSFTVPGRPWVVQSWLAEVLYATVDRIAGPVGLQLLRGAVCALIAVLAVHLAIRLTGDMLRGAALATGAVVASFLLWNERPLLLGALAMLVLVWVVEMPESRLGRHPVLVLPVLFWLWANAHGSFALGFAYVALHLLGRRLDGFSPGRGRERSLVAGAALAVLACVANPLGLRLLTFPFHMLSLGGALGSVVEWQSPSLQGPVGFLYGAWAAITVIALARGGGARPSRRDVLVSVAFLGLGFWAQRNIVLAPLVCLPIVARALRREVQRPGQARPPIHWAAAGLVVVLGLMAGRQAAGGETWALERYPVEAMRMVEDDGLLGGRLLTTDMWSGYVISAYWPRQQVFMDDRFDMYPTALMDDYVTLSRGLAGWAEILERHDIGTVVWPVDKPLAQLLEGNEGWERVHRDEVAGVWVRR